MKTIKLKKYDNRKIYIPKNNLVKSGYVNLKQLAELIQDGFSIAATRKTDGVDCTNDVLKAVLSEGLELENSRIYDFVRSLNV